MIFKKIMDLHHIHKYLCIYISCIHNLFMTSSPPMLPIGLFMRGTWQALLRRRDGRLNQRSLNSFQQHLPSWVQRSESS